jgi:glycosyltransferase involved in cell wall biosynthesis
LIHAHYGFHSALIPALVKRKPLITTFHGSDALKEPFRNRFYYFLQKFIISRSDRIIAVSKDIENTLIRRLSADPYRIHVISCGVNTSTFMPMNKIEVRRMLGIAEEIQVVLSAGRITYMKGVDLLYKCARVMSNVLFILVGEGPVKSDLKNCWLVGPRSHEEMPMWMNAADVFVLPSRSEGTPVVLLEALSCGIPVISTNVGGCADVIKNGQNGFLVPMGNANMLQEKISYLLEKDGIRTSMGIEGRKDMINGYDNRKIAEKIAQLYRDTISSKEYLCGMQ